MVAKKIEELETKNKEIETKNMEMKKEFETHHTEMKKEISDLKKVNTNIDCNNNTTNNNTTNNTMNVIVMTNAFGKENIDFIEDDGELFRKILKKGFQSIHEYVKNVHYDENKPENHNIYIPNWKDKKKALVYDGKKWNLENTDNIIDELKNRGTGFIQRKYEELDANNPSDSRIIAKLDRFLESLNTEDKKKIEKLDEDISLILYNNREIPINTRKITKK